MGRIILWMFCLTLLVADARSDATLFKDHGNDETSMVGFHCVIPPRKDRAKMLRLVDELANMGINTLVLQVDYRYQFESHREIGDGMWYNFDDAQELALHCAEKGMRLIPQMSCVGHQSYGGGAEALKLLKEYPQFDETPLVPATSDAVLYREWCVSNDDIYPIVTALIDDITRAFNAKDFHVGMDEIFLMGDGKCDRCRGKDRSALMARAVNKLHAHIVDEKHMTMYMWGDRLLDGKATKYGKWEGSENDTFRAIDMIPRDIVICDWHYEVRDNYPSVKIFLDRGFRVWPAVWREEEATRNFIRDAVNTSKSHATGAGDPVRTQGVLFTTWVYPEIFGILYGEGDPALSHPYYLQAVQNVNVGMRALGLETTPLPPTFKSDALAFVDKPTMVAIAAEEGALVRYTLDGSDVTEKSDSYREPLVIAKPTVIHARAFNRKGASLIARAEVKRVRMLSPAKVGAVEQGLAVAVHKGTFDRVENFAKADMRTEALAKNFDPAVAEMKSGFGIEFSGFLSIEKSGVYTFHLSSNDGSVLWIDGKKLVDNDGVHVAQWRHGAIGLVKGLHAVRLRYFNKSADGGLQVEWQTAGVARGKIPDAVLFRAK